MACTQKVPEGRVPTGQAAPLRGWLTAPRTWEGPAEVSRRVSPSPGSVCHLSPTGGREGPGGSRRPRSALSDSRTASAVQGCRRDISH